METPRAPIDQQLGEVVKQTPLEQKIRNVVRGAVEVGKAVVMLPFSCGYVSPLSEPVSRLTGSRDLAVHDHDGKKMVFTSKGQVEYNPSVHGELKNWKEEGDTVHEVHEEIASGGRLKKTLKERWIHDHKGKAGVGVHEFRIVPA